MTCDISSHLKNIFYTFQLDAREREIQRLNCLFTGGRPASALGKDCCYRSVSTLADDVEHLQKEKIALQQKLSDTRLSEQAALKQALHCKNKTRQLEQELIDIEKVAMNVESQANLSVMEKEKLNDELREKLDHSIKRINDLEKAFQSCGFESEKSPKQALLLANAEKKMLHKKINEQTVAEKRLMTEIEHIKNKYLKLKTKMKTTAQGN
jgi:centrosomal protein CEP135